MKNGVVVSVNISVKKGTPKTPVNEIMLETGKGVINDAHYGTPLKEISLLSTDSIAKVKIPNFTLKPGDFAENITFSGIDIKNLIPGTILSIGEASLEISQIGKECHHGCAIFKKVGKCIMPKEGLFAYVRKGGIIKPDMNIIIKTP